MNNSSLMRFSSAGLTLMNESSESTHARLSAKQLGLPSFSAA
jgi:hypothetical protein